VEKGKEVKIFNTPFSQYVRFETDVRHYMALGRARRKRINELASRIIMGAGFAYGNSLGMPFIKSFFIGGTNSIRAYRARGLGPGTYYGGFPGGFG
jgi:outer membrane protein assembly factor BamA